MSDQPHPWDDAPVYMDFEQPAQPKADKPKRKKKRKSQKDDPGKTPEGIPRLPQRDLVLTGDEVKRGLTDRERAVLRLRKNEVLDFDEIAELCGLADAKSAQRLFYSALAKTAPEEDIEVTRMMVTGWMEQLVRRSLAMSGAAYLVLDDGTKVPNTEQARWHQLAQIDVMNYATVRGAKMPAKVEISASDAEIDRLARTLLSHMGHEEIVDADVLELEVLPPAESLGDDEEV